MVGATHWYGLETGVRASGGAALNERDNVIPALALWRGIWHSGGIGCAYGGIGRHATLRW